MSTTTVDGIEAGAREMEAAANDAKTATGEEALNKAANFYRDSRIAMSRNRYNKALESSFEQIEVAEKAENTTYPHLIQRIKNVANALS